MLKEIVDYPTPRRRRPRSSTGSTPACSAATRSPSSRIDDVLRCRTLVRRVYVDPAISATSWASVYVTRHSETYIAPELARYVEFGASPRGEHRVPQAARALASSRAATTSCPRTSGRWPIGCSVTASSSASRRSPTAAASRPSSTRLRHRPDAVGRHRAQPADPGEEQALHPRSPAYLRACSTASTLGVPRSQPRLRRPARVRHRRRGPRHRLEGDRPARQPAGQAVDRQPHADRALRRRHRPRMAAADVERRAEVGGRIMPRHARRTSVCGTATSSASSRATPRRRTGMRRKAGRATSSGCSGSSRPTPRWRRRRAASATSSSTSVLTTGSGCSSSSWPTSTSWRRRT